MRVTKLTSLAAAAVLGLTATTAGAEGYGAVHYFDWSIDYDNLLELESETVRASGGYMFANYSGVDLGVEVHVASGGTAEPQFPPGVTSEEDITAELNKVLGIFAKPRLPLLGGLVNVYGLAGYSYGKVELLAETTAANVTEHGFSWGGGAEVALIRDRLYLAADYVNYIDSGDIEASAVSAGLRLLFSQ